MFSRCLTTRVTGYDQPPLQIMQMLYCFVNNIHVNYVELLWEGFHYSLKNPTTMIPYPRFRKLIASHYMTTFLEILRRARDRYHNLADDVIIKSIFNSGKSKDVPIESTQGTHRITSAHTTPNPVVAEGESSALRQSTVIRLRIPPRRSTRLIPPTPILTTDESDDLVLHDTLQVSLAEKKSCNELEAKQNVEKVKEHLMAEEIEKSQSDKESSEVEKIVDISQPVNVIKEEEESTEDDYELKLREKWKHVEEIKNTPSPTTIRSLGFSLISYLQIMRNSRNIQFMTRRKFDELAQCLQDIMLDSLPKLDDPYDDAHHEGENSGKRQKTSEHKSEPGPSTSCNQEQSDDFYFWTNSYAIDDDVIPNENVSQELVDEISQTIDEAKLRKVVDGMKEILVPPFQPKPTPVIQICQRDSKAHVLSLVNQDLLYLKKGNSRPEKIELSLHKFLVVL
ncbi:hypothetical protein Tco_0623182 [Tanacetum coccineum]